MQKVQWYRIKEAIITVDKENVKKIAEVIGAIFDIVSAKWEIAKEKNNCYAHVEITSVQGGLEHVVEVLRDGTIIDSIMSGEGRVLLTNTVH